MPPKTFAIVLFGVILAAGLTIWAFSSLGLPLTSALIATLAASVLLHRRSRNP